MPGHYDKGDYDSRVGGSSRYRGRGRGRGNYNWGSRGNSSGGRGYSRGGSSYSSGRYRGGGGHGTSGSYRDGGGHDRYSDSRRSGGQMVNPWEAGMGPRDASSSGNYGSHMQSSASVPMTSGGGTSDLIDSLNQLSYMGNDRSKLALNILNAVLSSDSSVSESRDGWDNGPPARKIRRIDWAGMRPPPVRKYPQRDHHYSPRRTWDRRGRGGHTYGPSEHHAGNEYQFRKMAKARRGKPWHDTRNSKGLTKDQKVKDDAETSDNPEGDTADADETAHTNDPSQSEASKEDGKEAENETKETEENQGAEGEEEEEKSEEKKDKKNKSDEITWLPREALRCHICSLSKFPDIKAYLRHLQSRKHENMKYSFHAKGAAILHFLRAESKLASQRRMLKNQRRGIKGPIMHCRKCQCEVTGYIREHAKTVEHIALKNFLRVQCCNNTYFNRADLEEHRLSLIHLKNQLELEQKRQKEEEEEKKEDTGVEESEEGKQFAEVIEEMRKKNPYADVTSPETLTPYDPALSHGLNFISKKSQYRCKVCPEARLITAKEAEEHFKSLDHYDNLVTHLNKVEEEKEKKRFEEKAREEELKKKQEDAAKKKEEESDLAKKNGEQDDGEEISFEDMHNMETVDEASEDVDMDTSAEASNGAAKDDVADEQIHSDEEEEEEEEEEEDEEEEDDEEEADGTEKLEDSLCLAEVGELLTENEDAITPEQETPVDKKTKSEELCKKEDESLKDKTSAPAEVDQIKKSSDEGKVEESNEQESVTEETDAPNNTEEKVKISTPATPRGRRGRGRGRGRSARN